MRISARNVIKGRVVSVETGATTAPVKLELAAGQVVAAAITDAAVDSLKLTVGSEAHAVVRALDVMIAVD